MASTHQEVFKRYLELGGGQDPRVDDLIFLARGSRVSLWLRTGRIAEATQAIEASERSIEFIQREALLARAELSVETGRFDDARRARQTLRERMGPSAKSPSLIGPFHSQWEARTELDAALAEGNAAAARTVFNRFVPVRPTGFDADISAYEGRVLLLEGKVAEALALARPAVETLRIRRPTPTRIQLHQTLGDALLATGQAAEAIPVLETGLALVPSIYEPEVSPRVALLHIALAEARFAVGDRPGAKQSLATGRAILAKHPVLGPQYLGPLARAEARIGAG